MDAFLPAGTGFYHEEDFPNLSTPRSAERDNVDLEAARDSLQQRIGNKKSTLRPPKTQSQEYFVDEMGKLADCVLSPIKTAGMPTYLSWEESLRRLFVDSKSYHVPFVVIPLVLAWASHFKSDTWGNTTTFALCFIAMIPLQKFFDLAGDELEPFLKEELRDLLIITLSKLRLLQPTVIDDTAADPEQTTSAINLTPGTQHPESARVVEKGEDEGNPLSQRQNHADEALQTPQRSSDVPEFGHGRPINLSIQFTLWWTPFLGLLGWWTDRPMHLLLDYFEVGMLLGACSLVNYVTADEKTNMSEGLTMISFYAMISFMGFIATLSLSS
ncbi:hypothetical protein V8D89_004843 [Ganoderma adspersum]